ncbi:type II toxin-antitoxin system RelE/ParE family toxin [Cardiobacterium sp. AH-315-I02]|nr:type II toxin-antitoxin system RelE/ParE family toxin [Cardiobacterium sp. AH-315-I02]
MKHELTTTDVFKKWQTKLKDRRAALAIATRLTRACNGNFGDVEPVGGGISEMRIFVGKGYRVYYIIRSTGIILLLCGGDKASQQRDIKTAKTLLKQLEE